MFFFFSLLQESQLENFTLPLGVSIYSLPPVVK